MYNVRLWLSYRCTRRNQKNDKIIIVIRYEDSIIATKKNLLKRLCQLNE